jgi:hypothetical protein
MTGLPGLTSGQLNGTDEIWKSRHRNLHDPAAGGHPPTGASMTWHPDRCTFSYGVTRRPRR